MSELSLIKEYLSKKGLAYITPRMLRVGLPVLILEVPRDRVESSASKEKTSHRQLALVSQDLGEAHGLRVIVILRDSQELDDIAASVRAVLRHHFPRFVADVHVFFETSTAAVVWVESKTIIDPEKSRELEEITKFSLAEFGVTCLAFDLVPPERPEASTVAILRAVKLHAPASLAAIRQDLERRGFASPLKKWLSHKLDAARKQGFVLRDDDGRFILTASGLEVVPWSRTASSSDVDRMLALGIRKRW